MYKNHHYILQHKCCLDLKQPIIVGVSGGADSLYLLDVLWRLKYPLVVVHINHLLRTSAGDDELLVQREAEARGLEYRVNRKNALEFAHEQKIAVEEAARTIRYQYLYQEAEVSGAQAVAVGHTADDQVETVLMHLLRGAGTAGLRGMSYRALPNTWSEQIPLVRPLLGVWREEILNYLDQQGIIPTLDETNRDTKYFRNRIRHELLPVLRNYNPSIRQVVHRMADVLRGDYEIIEQTVDDTWSSLVLDNAPGYLRMRGDYFRKQTQGLQRLLIRKAVAHLRPDLRDVDYEAIERVLLFLEKKSRGQVDVVGGLSFLIEGDSIWLARDEVDLPIDAWPQIGSESMVHLNVPGEYRLEAGWMIKTKWVDQKAPVGETLPENRFFAWLDGDRLEIPLAVRWRIAGERFKPAGMEGHMIKISDLMINIKLPERARSRWPLVVSGNEVVWIPGYRIADGYQAGSASRRVVLIELLQQA